MPKPNRLQSVIDRLTNRDLLLLIFEREDDIMADLAELQAAADAAAAAQTETRAQIAQLAAQVQAIIDAGTNGIDPAALDPIVAELQALATAETEDAAAVDAIVEPDA